MLRTGAGLRLAICGAAALLLAGAGQASAQAQASFPETVSLYAGFSPGGVMDLYTRMLGKHIGKHLPGNPQVIVKNMPGAGSRKLATYLSNIAKPDGSEFGLIFRTLIFDELLFDKKDQYDPRKFFYLGSPVRENQTCVISNQAKAQTLDEAKKTQLVMGGTSAQSSEYFLPTMLNHLLGTKMKSVSGYPGGNEMNMAIEKGELDGRCALSWNTIKASLADQIESKKLKVLIQLALQKHPDLPDVPWIMDYVKAPQDRDALKLIFADQVVARPFIGPPGLKPETRKILRDAFDKTMKDPEFLADTEKAKLEIDPVSGAEMEDSVREAYDAPKATLDRVRQLIGAQ